MLVAFDLVDRRRHMRTRLWIAAMIFPMINAVLFGMG